MTKGTFIPERIVSGGQTGADRAALDAAGELGIPSGGWVPKGRRAEDGPIPTRYEGLRETSSDSYEERTELNVRDSNATVVFTIGPPTGGSAFTSALARATGKPLLEIDLANCPPEEAAARLRAWLEGVSPRILNVAGQRESSAPGIARTVTQILLRVFGPGDGG